MKVTIKDKNGNLTSIDPGQFNHWVVQDREGNFVCAIYGPRAHEVAALVQTIVASETPAPNASDSNKEK